MSFAGTDLMIEGVVEKTRSYIDLPDVGSRFDDDWIVKHEVGSVIPDIIHRIRNWDSSTLYMNYDFTGVTDQYLYRMPVGCKDIVRLEQLDSNSDVVVQYLPRGDDHPRGYGWRVSGDSLQFAEQLSTSTTYRMVFTSSGDASLHTGSGALAADLSTLTLASTPTLGAVDRREGAYIGYTLRVKPTSGPIEERIITSHTWTGSEWTVGVREAFTDLTEASHTYEIVPWAMTQFWECVAVRAAMRIAAKLSASKKDQTFLKLEYNSVLKTAIESHEFRQNRRPPKLRTDGTPSLSNRGSW